MRYIKALLSSLMLLSLLVSCTTITFDGSRTGNDAQFIMEYKVLNTTESHEMDLEKETIIDVEIESLSGSIDIIVEDADGNSIYKGNDASSGKFSLVIPRTSTYQFTVTGEDAEGSVSFKARKE